MPLLQFTFLSHLLRLRARHLHRVALGSARLLSQQAYEAQIHRGPPGDTDGDAEMHNVDSII